MDFTRYSNTGGNTIEYAGLVITEYLTGRITTAHNGNVTKAREIRKELKGLGLNFNASSDSEVVSSLIAYHTAESKVTLVWRRGMNIT
jgi:amidophosphoribosyltransferase